MREISAIGNDKITLPGTKAHHKQDKIMLPDEDPSQFSYQISEMALQSALNALRFAQVVLLVVEGRQGSFTKTDLQIARKCLTEGRALVVAANKADVLNTDGVSLDDYAMQVQMHCDDLFKEFGSVPVVACSAIKNIGVKSILDTVKTTHDAWSSRVSTWVLNSWLNELLAVNPPPRIAGKLLKLKYITQVKVRPPCFAFFTNAEKIPGFYERFLRSKIQGGFNLKGVPIKIIIKKTKGLVVKKHLLNQRSKARRVSGEVRSINKNRRTSGRDTYKVIKGKLNRDLLRKKRISRREYISKK